MSTCHNYPSHDNNDDPRRRSKLPMKGGKSQGNTLKCYVPKVPIDGMTALDAHLAWLFPSSDKT
eukprot:728940-Amphidinium_carterae.1